MVLCSADIVACGVSKADIHILHIRPYVRPGPHAYYVYARLRNHTQHGVNTTRSQRPPVPLQLRLGGTELRHCCLPFDVRLQRALQKERPVSYELHAHIQQVLLTGPLACTDGHAEKDTCTQ